MLNKKIFLKRRNGTAIHRQQEQGVTQLFTLWLLNANLAFRPSWGRGKEYWNWVKMLPKLVKWSSPMLVNGFCVNGQTFFCTEFHSKLLASVFMAWSYIYYSPDLLSSQLSPTPHFLPGTCSFAFLLFISSYARDIIYFPKSHFTWSEMGRQRIQLDWLCDGNKNCPTISRTYARLEFSNDSEVWIATTIR